MSDSDVLWRPSAARIEDSELTRYRRWLGGEQAASDYLDLWRWSTHDPGRFWSSLVEFEQVRLGGAATGPVAPTNMPGGRWFPGRTVNYAEHLLREAPDAALLVVNDDNQGHVVSRDELIRQVGALSATLRSVGVGPGDRVVAVLSNRAEAVVGLLAAAAIGAIWAICSPEFGATAIVSRFAQLEPKVLLGIDGYRYGGKIRSSRDDIASIAAQLPTVEQIIWVDSDSPGELIAAARPVRSWSDATAGDAPPEFAEVPFEHPLWVLFSSGTTGVPKGIVHGHGGILLETLKMLHLQVDLHRGERFLNVGSTSWAVWNTLVSSLGVGATPVLFEGSPVWPEVDRLWQVVAEHDVAVMGLGAGYLHACLKADVRPPRSALRTLLVTGSPLSAAGYRWVYDRLGDLWLASMSGGTDICSIFVGGAPDLPVRAGRLQPPALGAAVEAWDPHGHHLVGQRGELVVTRPMPSMPLYFWNDPDGRRYRESYFDMFPGIWRHGDYIEFDEDGTSFIHGRSDSTLNRQGVRMGPGDIYQVVEAIPEVQEALVVGVERGEDYYMPLFVAVADDADFGHVKSQIRAAIRAELSPRHVPDEVIQVRAIPHTRTGKKLEVPVKRLLQGEALADVVDLGTVDDPQLLHDLAT
ncbi:acetoacetate--CoA ligase [Cryptosporangium phraense]|uniref:Acetoacetate--CoA ligase n=1 Tax=Cryptosporangium phraense TaxID=2593070 RepID=A0A545AUW7_9ACTN|nr:acetoacetate--CoA ligase [Cryptosporangium phraense]TQS45114.1 acetoacetate--CoA ligase [Cryptosporangium phraense]